MSIMQKFKEYTQEDKQALRELKAECEAKTGSEIRQADLIRAVEPEETTPDHLANL